MLSYHFLVDEKNVQQKPPIGWFFVGLNLVTMSLDLWYNYESNMSQNNIENGYSGIGDAIDAKISITPKVLGSKNGIKAVFLEVPTEALISADGMSGFFDGNLPKDLDSETQARLTLVSGETSKTLKLAVFAGSPLSPRVDTFRLDLTDVDPQITYNHDLAASRRPYLADFDVTVRQLIDGSRPADRDIMELQTMLEEYAKGNNWREKDTREIQNSLMIAQLHHRVKDPDGKMRPQRRESGELYISHPWAVFEELIKSGIKDPDILKAALVHDVPEDSPTMRQPEIDPETGVAPKSYAEWRQETWDILAPMIGPVAATYAMSLARPKPDGLTLFSKEQANLLYRLNLTKYHQALLIKMPDRLHNIRTLDSMPPEKQKATIISTIDNYVPIFEFARQSYPEAVDYLMDELFKALRIAGMNNGVDIDML